MKRPQDDPRRKILKTKFARSLRQQMTEPERRLWSALRQRRFAGLRFRRQQALGPYVVDFYCAAAKLIVELDGGQHFDAQHVSYDTARTKWLEAAGYHVLRFTNLQFLKERDTVLDIILDTIRAGGADAIGRCGHE